MKLYKKIIIIISVLLIVAGGIITIIAERSIDWNDSSIFDVAAPKAVTYEVEEKFENISANATASNIRLAVSDDGKCKVVCDESKKFTYRVEVKDNTLEVSIKETGEWYQLYFGWHDTEITIYLPEKAYGKFSATSTSGDIYAPDDFEFGSAQIKSTSGDIRFLSSVKGDAVLKTTSGTVRAEKFTAKYVEAISTSGEVTLTDIECCDIRAEATSGDVEIICVIAENHLHAECVSGDIELHSSDAQTLFLKSTSGDIEGSLLSEKVFITDTTSGEVQVPHTTSGGKCEIKTTSGDVEIIIKK